MIQATRMHSTLLWPAAYFSHPCRPFCKRSRSALSCW